MSSVSRASATCCWPAGFVVAWGRRRLGRAGRMGWWNAAWAGQRPEGLGCHLPLQRRACAHRAGLGAGLLRCWPDWLYRRQGCRRGAGCLLRCRWRRLLSRQRGGAGHPLSALPKELIDRIAILVLTGETVDWVETFLAKIPGEESDLVWKWRDRLGSRLQFNKSPQLPQRAYKELGVDFRPNTWGV